jgi:hypothetical protein
VTFSISATNKHGPIKLVRRTAREAFDLAMTYRAKGFEDIQVVNTETGETFVEAAIVENRLPSDSADRL